MDAFYKIGDTALLTVDDEEKLVQVVDISTDMIQVSVEGSEGSLMMKLVEDGKGGYTALPDTQEKSLAPIG